MRRQVRGRNAAVAYHQIGSSRPAGKSFEADCRQGYNWRFKGGAVTRKLKKAQVYRLAFHAYFIDAAPPGHRVLGILRFTPAANRRLCALINKGIS
jgi:hypothetical protein